MGFSKGDLQMKKMHVSELLPGMIVAEDVLNYNNQMVLSKGTVLTDKTIVKLEFYSVYSIRIEDNPEIDLFSIPDDSISYVERLRGSQEYQLFKKEFDREVDSLKSSINDIVNKNASIDFHKLLQDTLALLNAGGTKVHVFDMLHSMRLYDDLTYAHSVNVALICNVFAEWLGMSAEDVNIATLCGLLHDIGKLSIPDSIIKKPAKLTDTEYAVVQTHPVEGYKLLAPYRIDDRIKRAALCHHERSDGSGYPAHLTGSRLDLFTKMVSIADVYDAMTSPRIYRGPLCPFTVISLFETEGLHKYDTKLILIFMQRIVGTYLLNSVRLSNGVVGKIVYINQNALSRPVIKCGDDFIDLLECPEISIEAMI